MIPKSSPEFEQRVLETLMHYGTPDKMEAQQALTRLTPDCFYKPIYREIFELISKCYRESKAFDLVSIMVLVAANSLLYDTMTQITNDYGKYCHGLRTFDSDIDSLLNLAALRQKMSLASRAIEEAQECPDAYEAKSMLDSKLSEALKVSHGNQKSGLSSAEIADAYYEGNLEKDLLWPTTSNQLNFSLGGGVMAKSLITIAAAAGVGKTNFSLYLMDAIARKQVGTQTLFFSLEMEYKHIWMRHAGICGGKQFERMTEVERDKAVFRALEVPMTIYDNASCRKADEIDFILSTARLKAHELPVSVIVVDYLGLVSTRGNFERNDLRQADITTKLAKLAMELNCVVIALSQVNRGVATSKEDQCPQPHHAADSSGSHRSSTLWLGIDRPELYRTELEFSNQFVIKCRKNRFGKNFELTLAFNDGTFAEVSSNYFQKPKVVNLTDDLFRHRKDS